MIKLTLSASNAKILVVGSNSGIGLAFIKKLKTTGAQIIGIDIQATSKENIDLYHCLDPRDFNAMQEIAKTTAIQELDALVNLSGSINTFKTINTLSIEEWNETFDISFKSCLNSCKAFIPNLKKDSTASIVNMSSGLAFIGQKNYGPYSAAKASIISLTKTLASELAPQIRVNSLAPGAVDTNFIYEGDGSTRINLEAYKKMVPLESMAKPEEIADLIIYLISTSASHMTGQCIHINGGAMML